MGGAGFIGSHIAHTLLEHDHEVVVLDNMDPYYDLGSKSATSQSVARRPRTPSRSSRDRSPTRTPSSASSPTTTSNRLPRGRPRGRPPDVEQPKFYEENNVGGILTLLETDAADGEDLNVGSTDNITINELAEAVVDATDADVEPVHEEAKAGDARHTHADVSKAADLLGYEPTVDIRTGVEQFVEWYQANQEWYRPLAAE